MSTFAPQTFELHDADLLRRLRNCEDSFVERKTIADAKDWLKTAVAFANSTPIGYPAILFIGAKDDGTIENNIANLDSVQKTFNKKMEDAYPTIYYLPRVLSDGERQCIAIVIPGSESRPHFAGPSYVRVGSETRVASEAQFNRLIAERQSTPYEILKWKGQEVTVAVLNPENSIRSLGLYLTTYSCLVIDCTTSYVVVQKPGAERLSFPLGRVTLSLDTEKNNRLKLEVRQTL
jgi:hypothetical protein